MITSIAKPRVAKVYAEAADIDHFTLMKEK